MPTPREEQRQGLAYLEAVTALLRRGRGVHPTKGLYEAAKQTDSFAGPTS